MTARALANSVSAGVTTSSNNTAAVATGTSSSGSYSNSSTGLGTFASRYTQQQPVPPHQSTQQQYGPASTGTSTAAAGTKKISFFMRKGADCLSKWVGEGERQLRLLFEQAKKYQPSIIFFDGK